MTDISSLYLKTHNKTREQYLGVTSRNPKKYLGSSKSWKKHIKKYGRHDVTTDILFQDTICLLYTSPSPRDSCASRMPSSA